MEFLNENGRSGGSGQQAGLVETSLPRWASNFELWRALATNESLQIARTIHGANPKQETAAIFEFLRELWTGLVDRALEDAALLYAEERAE